ncbi:MAG TPA: FGGY-family carbohydrate kinase, partial [Chloroflexota bacterium]
ILWLRDSDPDIVDGAKWLSVSDYIVFRLTGHIVTDPSLAARTYAYRIVEERWDQSLLDRLGLDEALFPTVLPAGEPAGSIEPAAAADTGLPRTATAAVAGHDHICALFAAGIMEPGQVLDSIGTAESLLGVIALSELGENELRSGLVIVPHLLPGRFCWLGGLRSAGGSVEWIRGQLAVEALSYEDAIDLAEQAGDEPTGILYFPYLTGRGGVCPDEHIRAAFVGLDASHGRPHLIKAVLEGTSYESESIRRAAERLSERPVDELIAVGGGTMNRPWMQVKADVTGCRVSLPPIAEASTLGAALAAGLRRGVIGGEEDITRMAASVMRAGEVIEPDAGRHAAYRRLYEGGYEAFGSALRRLSHDMIGTSRSYAWGGR